MTTAVRVQPIPLCGVPFKSTSGPSAGWHWIAVGFHLTMSFAFDSTTPVSGRTISMENAERFWGFAHGAKCVAMPVPVSMSNYQRRGFRDLRISESQDPIRNPGDFLELDPALPIQ